MQTQCSARQFEFEAIERRRVVAAFDGGAVSSDAGALLLSGLDRGLGLIERFAGCFDDGRDPGLIEHSVKTLVGQRVLGLALGYEDLIDHDELRHDPLWAAALGKLEPGRRSQCAELAEAKRLCEESAKPARRFKDFVYRTLDSWSAARRVIGKAGHLPAGANPRFIVTSLEPAQWEACALYEDLYCARGWAQAPESRALGKPF